MRVLRFYHAGRDAAHRDRERALVRAGVDLTLVVPTAWPGAEFMTGEPFDVVELPVARAGDVNRHRYADPGAVAALVGELRPDVVDLHEEPFSAVTHQLLRVLARDQSVVAYTAQNLDKRFPPPFAQYERAALRRLDGLYPCSAQAASVAVGKGFYGALRVLPLAASTAFTVGNQRPPTDELRLVLVGRLVPEKGVLDAVRVLAAAGPGATLTLIGDGPEVGPALQLAQELGVGAALDVQPWVGADALAEHYRRAHVVLVPSTATRTWVEQFGRVVVEAHASGAVVVAYASGALPEVVGDAGLLVPAGDTVALVSAVRRLRAEPALWTALRDAGRARAVTWDDVAVGQLDLYRQAVTGAGVRQGVRRPAPTRARRVHATGAFGPPAVVPGPARPFALPVLRDGVRGAATLASFLDVVSVREAPSRERLRVVYVDHVARPSGGEIALARLLAALPDVEAHVILAEDGPMAEQFRRAGATVEVLPLDPGARDTGRDAAVSARSARSAAGAAAYTVRLARRLRRLRPDLVHTNSLKAGVYGCAAARLARVPAVWHLRDRLAPDYLPERAIAVTRGLLAHLPSAVLCPSDEVARHVGGPALVVADAYAPARPPRVADRSLAVVGIVGRISRWKGQDVVLRAVARVPGLQLRIVGTPLFGEDDYLAELHALAAELGVADRVTFVGFTADIESELDRLDVLVHASTVPEPFGQVIVEGLAAGVPVIATDAGGPREIITDGVDGLLVTAGDIEALVRALVTLRADASLRRQLAENGLRRAAAYAPERIGEQVRGVYRTVLGAPAATVRGA